jgi:hypothetical protein
MHDAYGVVPAMRTQFQVFHLQPLLVTMESIKLLLFLTWIAVTTIILNEHQLYYKLGTQNTLDFKGFSYVL